MLLLRTTKILPHMDASAASSRGLGTLTGSVRLHCTIQHYAPFLQGIGSGQRQLIDVTCIAEHA